MNYVIPDSQFGFRKDRSCEDCLAILNLEICNLFVKGCDDGVSSGIAESRESPSTIINYTLGRYRTIYGANYAKQRSKWYAKRRLDDSRN